MTDLFGDAPMDRLDEVVAELRRHPGWPVDDVKDRALVAEMISSFPGLDVVEEAKAWRIWMMDHEQKKEVRPRARFHTWLRRARGDFDSRGGAAGKGARPRRTSTVARSADAHGATSTGLSRW